jgi:hypothetical protein
VDKFWISVKEGYPTIHRKPIYILAPTARERKRKNLWMKIMCLDLLETYQGSFVSDSTALCWILAVFQSVGLLGWRISLSQGLYLQTGQHKHRINANRHPYFEWNSNPWPHNLSNSSVAAISDIRTPPHTIRNFWLLILKSH